MTALGKGSPAQSASSELNLSRTGGEAEVAANESRAILYLKSCQGKHKAIADGDETFGN